MFLADLFLVVRDVGIASFTNDNTPVTSANNIDDLIDSLEKASSSLFNLRTICSKAIQVSVTC